MLPIGFLAFYDAIFCGIVKNGFFNEVKHKWQIKTEFIFLFNEFLLYLVKQQVFVHSHKIAFDIEFKDITISGIILRAGTDKMVNAFYAIMCSFAQTTA